MARTYAFLIGVFLFGLASSVPLGTQVIVRVPAPVGAQYWVGADSPVLTNEHNLGALATGLVINTAGVPSAYAGTSCTNQFPRSLSASGAATCASVDLTTDATGITAPRVPYGAASGLTSDADFTFDSASNTISLTGGYKERGRSVALGEWIDVAYDSGNYVAGGGGTWTVDASDQIVFSYTVIGDTVCMINRLNATSVSGTVSNLLISLPSGFVSALDVQQALLLRDNSATFEVGIAFVGASATTLSIVLLDLSGFAASANNTFVRTNICFPVQ